MTVRSQRLFGREYGPAHGVSVVYTSPPGFVTIVKSFRIVSLSNRDLTVSAWIEGPDVSEYIAAIWEAAVIQPHHVLSDQTWMVMEPGDTFWFRAIGNETDVVGISASGAQLPL